MSETTREIPLTRGYVALVDEVDYDDLACLQWHVTDFRVRRWRSGPYAGRSCRVDGLKRTELMHRRLLPGATYIDHIDGDGLNNRRSNLRPATAIQNGQNRSQLNADNTSGYRGVHWNKRERRFQAYIRLDGRRKHLGYFDTAEEAALAFDVAAVEMFGEYAGYLNFSAVS